MKDYAKQEWLNEKPKHRIRDAVLSTIIYGAIAVLTYWFIVELSA